MSNSLKIIVKNTKDELLSFPIDHSLLLEFSDKVEDSLLESYIYLVQGLDSPNILHIGDTYNQNLGIVKESFSGVPVSITIEKESPFTVKVSPKTPLTPGYPYTLLVRDKLPREYLSTTKLVSYSNSSLNVKTNLEIDSNLVINKDSILSPSKHIIDVSFNGDSKVSNIYNNNTINIGGATITFGSDVYLEGETFHIVSVKSSADTGNSFTVSLRAAPSKNIKPIEDINKKLTECDILNFNANLSKEDDSALESRIEYLSKDRFNIKFNKNIVSKLDLENLMLSTREAFGIYTLEDRGLYDPTKKYNLNIEETTLNSIQIKVEIIA